MLKTWLRSLVKKAISRHINVLPAGDIMTVGDLPFWCQWCAHDLLMIHTKKGQLYTYDYYHFAKVVYRGGCAFKQSPAKFAKTVLHQYNIDHIEDTWSIPHNSRYSAFIPPGNMAHTMPLVRYGALDLQPCKPEYLTLPKTHRVLIGLLISKQWWTSDVQIETLNTFIVAEHTRLICVGYSPTSDMEDCPDLVRTLTSVLTNGT